METKEMFLKLPMVEINDWSEIGMKATYPGAGKYIVRHANGDTQVVDIMSWPDEGETVGYSATCVGSNELYDPDEWVLAIDLENAKLAYEADSKQVKEDLQQAHDFYEAEMAEQKEKCEAICRETEENCDKLIKEKEKELSAHAEENDRTLAMRRMELEQEYEKKKLQLELDTPKRFAQGEWVSGKTLTEIIKVIVNGKEDRV